MHLFHCPDLGQDMIHLPEDEAHHAGSVLRLRSGDRVGLLDGRGTRAEATITSVDKKGCAVRILTRSTGPSERIARMHLAVAPTKQMDRFEWMLEKCTEIGVDRITPVLTERTERSHLRLERLHKVLVSAMKQSQRSWLPALDAPTSLADLLETTLPQQRLFGWCEGERDPISSAYDPGTDAIMLIGPEGDLTPEEAVTLRSSGFKAVSLGTARLRTETAAMAACTWMNFTQLV